MAFQIYKARGAGSGDKALGLLWKPRESCKLHFDNEAPHLTQSKDSSVKKRWDKKTQKTQQHLLFKKTVILALAILSKTNAKGLMKMQKSNRKKEYSNNELIVLELQSASRLFCFSVNSTCQLY